MAANKVDKHQFQYFVLFQLVSTTICYPVCWVVHIKTHEVAATVVFCYMSDAV